jgi:hypothetical protein
MISHEKYYTLRSSTEIDIAVLNVKVSDCLRELQNHSWVRYEGFIAVDEWANKTHAWHKTGKAGTMSVNINVSGTRDLFELVGKVFSTAKLYLQQPYYCDDFTKYSNPHYLSFPSTAEANADFFSTPLTLQEATPTLHQCDISHVLKDLHQHEYLRPVDVDRCIKTPLLRFVHLFSLGYFNEPLLTLCVPTTVIRKKALTT